MATWFVDSTAGGTASGTSWVNACLTLAAAITLSAAGDDFNVASSHAETAAATKTLTFKGTPASPNRIFCCDKTNTPALSSDLLPASGSTTPAGGASVSTTGAFSIVIAGSFRMRGLSFNAGSSSSAGSITIANGNNDCQTYELCAFNLNNTATTSKMNVGGNGNAMGLCDLIHTSVTFGNASQTFNFDANGYFRWRGQGSSIGGATFPTTLISTFAQRGNVLEFDGIDLSALGANTIIGAGAANWYKLNNCKLGASAVVAAASTLPGVNRIDVINCDNGATTYRNERYAYEGTLRTDTVDVRSGGATDGTTPVAHKVVTTANAKATFPFECFDILQFWSTGLGSSHTVSIPIMSNATLTNADIWPEVEYLGSAGSPLGSLASGGLADPLASASNWATDGVSSWTTTGVSGPIQQTLSVSFTPQLAGYVRVRIRVAKASQTLRIDPLIQIV